jgi:hypothetical protein
MPELPNLSDQFGMLVEILSNSRDQWICANLGLCHYDEKSNVFLPWVEAQVDVYEADLSLLRRLLEDFASVTDSTKNFVFEPQVEPSFTISLERIPHGNDFCRVASIALDMKVLFRVSVPTAYREDRLSLRFHTNEQRLQRFIADLIRQIEGSTKPQIYPADAGTSTS